jgi:hypothetical protein
MMRSGHDPAECLAAKGEGPCRGSKSHKQLVMKNSSFGGNLQNTACAPKMAGL